MLTSWTRRGWTSECDMLGFDVMVSASSLCSATIVHAPVAKARVAASLTPSVCVVVFPAVSVVRRSCVSRLGLVLVDCSQWCRRRSIDEHLSRC
jgi:hypothetical protein